MTHREKTQLRLAARELARLLVGLLLMGSAFVALNLIAAIR
jgi:hypothetical protein